jgi:hypothetical protein
LDDVLSLINKIGFAFWAKILKDNRGKIHFSVHHFSVCISAAQHSEDRKINDGKMFLKFCSEKRACFAFVCLLAANKQPTT